MERKLVIHIATAAPRVSRGLKVLSPAPFVLKSYVNWRLPVQSKKNIQIDVTLFGPDDSPEAMAATLLAAKADIIAFSLYVWNHQDTLACAKIIKEKNPAITIVLGGPQASPIAEELLYANPFIDIIPFVTTPGETIFYHLIVALLGRQPLSEVAGVLFRKADGNLEKTSAMVEPMDLNDPPSPFLDGTITFTDDIDYYAVLETARGCPFDCGYCFWGSGGREMSYFPRQRVEQEIDLLYSEPNVKHVYFADSDVLIKRERAEWMVDRLLSKGGTTAASFELDARNITKPKRSIVEKLARLPDFQFVFAIQTTNQKALDTIGITRPKPKVFKERLALLRSWLSDVRAVVDIMLPLPEDTPEGFRQTLNDVLALTPTRLVLNYPVYLLPGTRFYAERHKLGLTYLQDPPHPVVETDTFPKAAVNKAFQLGIWAEIITYYHPAAGDFFHTLTRLTPEQPPIARLASWIAAIEKKLPLMEHCEHLVDYVVAAVENLNAAKGALLSRACEPRSGLLIYKTILELEQTQFAAEIKPIQHGVEVFQSAVDSHTKWLDMESYSALFPELNGQEHISCIPRFRRHADAVAAQQTAMQALRRFGG